MCQGQCAFYAQQGGTALFVDYGHTGEKEDTIRGFKNHKLVDPLDYPGESDITADVNFNHLREVACSIGLEATDPIKQKEFLKNMGIDTRLLILLKQNTSTEGEIFIFCYNYNVEFVARENLTKCHEYLMQEMGDRFQFMAISHPARSKTETEVTGFYPIKEDLTSFMRTPRNINQDEF